MGKIRRATGSVIGETSATEWAQIPEGIPRIQVTPKETHIRRAPSVRDGHA